MLINIETSSPPFKISQNKAVLELKKRMNTRPAAERFIDAAAIHSGIETRYIVIPDAEADPDYYLFTKDGNPVIPDTKKRMMEYEKWAKELSINVAEKVISSSGITPEEINRLITISCTGFYAPGYDYDLIQHFKFPYNIRRTNIGFMGCAASLIGFNSALEILSSNDRSDTNILIISVELCSLHLQMEPSRDNILSNMIFADGAAAALFSNSHKYISKGKMELLSAHSILFDNSQNLMGWKIGNTGFEMNLSSELPAKILAFAVPAIGQTIKSTGIDIKDIKHWALHPGGRAILDSLQNGLGLTAEKMEPSRNVLCNYGNMSSASILFVIKEILTRGVNKNELCCAIAFGPGLTMEIALMKGA
jgi:predicted naringenin-chalcone synthase